MKISLLLLSGLFTSSFAQSPQFYAYPIQELGGQISAYGINDSGRVVGQWTSPLNGSSRPFVTGARGIGTSLIEIEGRILSGYAIGINNRDVIIGSFSDPNTGLPRAFVYSEERGARPLLHRPSERGDYAQAINDRNQIVGSLPVYKASRDIYINEAFITNPDGKVLSRLGDLPETFYPSGINEAGQVVGTAFTDFENATAYITGPDGVGSTRLGLGQAYAINNVGEAAGYFVVNDEIFAFSTRHGTDIVNSRKRPEIYTSMAYAIGPNGTIGGSAQATWWQASFAFVAKPKGPLLDLNSLVVNGIGPVYRFTRVSAINSKMQAVVRSDNGRSYIVCPTIDCL